MEEDVSLDSADASDVTKDDITETPPHPKSILKRFIKVYKDSPELWDTAHKDYYNRFFRNQALDKLLIIYKQLNSKATRVDVRRKINTLRTNYRKEANKIECAKRDGVFRQRSWAFNAMQFLSQVDKSKNQTTEQDEETDSEDTYSYVVTEDIQEEEEESPLFQPSLSQPSYSYVLDETPKQEIKKKKISPKKNKMLEIKCQPISKPHQTTLESSNVDPISVVWSSKLRKLDPMQRLFAEKAINDVLFEAQLNNLDRDSVKINCPLPQTSSAAERGSHQFPPTYYKDPLRHSNVDTTSTDNSSYPTSIKVQPPSP